MSKDRTPVKVEVVTTTSFADLTLLDKPDFHLAYARGQVAQEVSRKGREDGIEIFWDSIRVEQYRLEHLHEVTTRAYGWGYENG